VSRASGRKRPNRSGVTPQARRRRRILLQGWIDAIRALHPKEPIFTFWDYKRNRWGRNGGLRLDHILLSPALTERLQDAGVDRHTRGMEGASDHAPVRVMLRDAPSLQNVAAPRDGGRAAIAATKAEKSVRQTGLRVRQRGSAANAGKLPPSRRPLLVIDGDSFAHRSYHAFPKTIRRSDGRGAGVILGFANFLLRFYAGERPRAVIVGWDSLEAPTNATDSFPLIRALRNCYHGTARLMGSLRPVSFKMLARYIRGGPRGLRSRRRKCPSHPTASVASLVRARLTVIGTCFQKPF
jgi:5'-3' exonuclease, N-terminal resolvase-like domain